MPDRISDLRNAPSTIDEATALFNRLARARIALAVTDAQLEKRIAKLKAEHEAANVQAVNEIDSMETALSKFILGNRALFKDPRKIKTQFGSFGLQTVTDVVIEDEEAAKKSVVKQKFKDCFQLALRLVKTGLKSRIEAGEKISGVTVRTGDTAVYKIEKALIDRAKSEAV